MLLDIGKHSMDTVQSNNTSNSYIGTNITIPKDTSLMDILLPNEWILYLYDKQVFKKIANKANFQARPHKALYTITTVNDLVYILKLMAVKNKPQVKYDLLNNNKINLDTNDYIIMRKGIEPIWEDPKNSNGGTFTIKLNHTKGYDLWSLFVMYMLGETMTNEMHNINGITVSYIADPYNFSNGNTNNCYTYIKIWDAKPGRTKHQFIDILPPDLYNKINNESLMYSQNNTKKDFNERTIITKLQNSEKNNRNKGGFRSQNRRH